MTEVLHDYTRMLSTIASFFGYNGENRQENAKSRSDIAKRNYGYGNQLLIERRPNYSVISNPNIDSCNWRNFPLLEAETREAMGRRKAIRIIFQEEPIETGTEYPVVFEFRIRDKIELLEVTGVFEGVCRCTVNGQDTSQSLLNVPLDLSQLFQNQIPSKEKLVLPQGVYRIAGVINLSTDSPGSFRGKFGAIAYRFRVSLRARRHGEEATLDNDREVDVIGAVPFSMFPAFEKPVSLSRQLKKKFLCFNRMDAQVKLEMEKAAFMPGEYILVTGEIENAAGSSTLKGVCIELRQRIQYKSGDGTRKDNRLICRLNCGTCAAGSTMKLHHSVQVPNDIYPTLAIPNSAIQVFYEILVTCSGYFEVDIPVFIGNKGGYRKQLDSASAGSRSRSRTSSRSSRPKSAASSFDKSSLHSDPYFYVPMSEFSDRPPPYPGFQGRAYFVPIHVQARTSAFQPAFGITQMPPFREFPPGYNEFDAQFGAGRYRNGFPDQPQYSSQPSPRERFLKIEEIE